jgi:hypothetical protein
MAPSIVLFVAARKGSQEKQKSTLKACDPVVTLRQLAASILGPDAEVGTDRVCTDYNTQPWGPHTAAQIGARDIDGKRFNELLMSKSKATNV